MSCGCGGGIEHEHAGVPMESKSLLQFIDIGSCHVLNVKKCEIETIFRSKYEGLSNLMESDTDPEIIIKIQFMGTVKIKAIAINGNAKDVSAYVNLPDLDFTTITGKPVAQEWMLIHPELIRDPPIFYPTK